MFGFSDKVSWYYLVLLFCYLLCVQCFFIYLFVNELIFLMKKSILLIEFKEDCNAVWSDVENSICVW
jgi:hypothetical protein